MPDLLMCTLLALLMSCAVREMAARINKLVWSTDQRQAGQAYAYTSSAHAVCVHMSLLLLCMLLLQTVERRGAELDTVLEAIDCCLRAKEVKQLLVQKAPGKSSKVTRVALLVVSNRYTVHTL
jgi:hypothetical protein